MVLPKFREGQFSTKYNVTCFCGTIYFGNPIIVQTGEDSGQQ